MMKISTETSRKSLFIIIMLVVFNLRKKYEEKQISFICVDIVSAQTAFKPEHMLNKVVLEKAT